MDKITLVDYIGNCDEQGNATGHVLKTLNEAIKMLEKQLIIDIITTKDYIKYFDKSKIKYSLNLSSRINYKKGLYYNLLFKIQKIYFTQYILRKEKKIWFINTDFWLLFSLTFFKKKKKQKIYITNYVDYYSNHNIKSKLKNFFFRKALKKIDYVFTTNANLNLKKHVYIPDYIFDNEFYDKFKCEKKQKIVYMCGGINAAKDVDGVIKAFNINKENLFIKGKFSSEIYFNKLKNNIGENIKIYNEVLKEDCYYKNIAKNLFIILPYKENNYLNRSSGVILESIFLESIVIAPNFLLKQLNIAGIGYDKIDELKEFKVEKISDKEIKEIIAFNKKILKRYDYENVKKVYIDTFLKK
ncbi:hypothetical protein ACV3UP_07465 [Clostridium perfringens]